METAFCNVIYVNSRARHDRCVTNGAEPRDWECRDMAENVKLLLRVFSEVHVCRTGGACLTQWLDLQDTSVVDGKPTLILIDTPISDRLSNRSRSRSTSPCSRPSEDDQDHMKELYGLALLQRITTESYLRNLSKLVIAVPIIDCSGLIMTGRPDGPAQGEPTVAESAVDEAMPPAAQNVSAKQSATSRNLLKRCLDLGATDVMISPMSSKCITNLEVHAYRARRDVVRDQKAAMEARRGRKRSWVGISDEKPYAYLREKMVANLMSRICRLDHIESEAEEMIANLRISLPPERQAEIAATVGGWQFCAYDLSEDDLVAAAATMFKHALSLPELEPWRITTDQLHSFLVACRAAYNDFVPFHNFRHVIDVLQATFNFLVQMGSLPPFPQQSCSSPTASPLSPATSPIARLITPFEALTLLITAIGHDVGHPGVNNGFLVTLNAPLAQVYNDRSVLESFHCAAYSQILRRYWPTAFKHAKMRNLMISSILSTDMGLHFDYVEKMGSLQRKLRESNTTEGWDARMVDEQKGLACALLIKCADISNVARKHPAAIQWMYILSEEFSRQRVMEKELNIPSSLFAAPSKKDLSELAKPQLGFMDTFAMPLFQGVADLFPALQYCLDELSANRKLFDQFVLDEQAKTDPVCPLLQRDDSFSPRTPSFTGSREPARLSATGSSDDRSVTEKGFHMDPVGRVGKTSSEFSDDLKATFQERLDEAFSKLDCVDNLDKDDMFDLVQDNAASRGPTKQRCSETTEGSSAPNSGDWASQATSATTSKLPLSPSTQGTSIISRDSLERPSSIPNTKPPGPSESLPALAPMTTITTAATSAMMAPQLEKGGPAIQKHLNINTRSFRLNSARSQPNLSKPNNHHVHTQISDKSNSEAEYACLDGGYGTARCLEIGTEGNKSVRKMSSWLRQKAQIFRKTTKTPSPRVARSSENDDTSRARRHKQQQDCQPMTEEMMAT